ncbi:MAG TPA: hypothetical protein ENK91_16305 [Bacteroidetes bacterium]|nr:hypothetical protein [Bacteroidota bacterium]
MKNKIVKTYPSKILLFGEYSVIDNSNALAIPFDKFYGSWEFNENVDNEIFSPYLGYLKKINWNNFDVKFDIEKLKKDISKGLFFKSNIPEGYGAGSSGALSAAIYDKYFKYKPKDINSTKRNLAQIEGYFHGTSSGIDPLVSFLNKGVLVKNTKDIEILEIGKNYLENYDLYLLDSKKPRETKHFVDIYNKQIKSEEFLKSDLNYLIDINNNLIDSFLKNDEVDMFDFYKEISKFQIKYFEKMILPEIFPVWKNSIESKEFAIKLCGAGGGGFYLILNKKDNELDILNFEITKI